MPFLLDYNLSMEQDFFNSTWLTFVVGQDKYAILSSDIKEILRNNDIFYIPFVPDYIKGVINSYGIPYAVFDVSSFLGRGKLTSRLYIILKDSNNLALQVDELLEFHADNEIDITHLSCNREYPYYSAILKIKDETVPVLDLKGIEVSIKAAVEGI